MCMYLCVSLSYPLGTCPVSASFRWKTKRQKKTHKKLKRVNEKPEIIWLLWRHFSLPASLFYTAGHGRVFIVIRLQRQFEKRMVILIKKTCFLSFCLQEKFILIRFLLNINWRALSNLSHIYAPPLSIHPSNSAIKRILSTSVNHNSSINEFFFFLIRFVATFFKKILRFKSRRKERKQNNRFFF